MELRQPRSTQLRHYMRPLQEDIIRPGVHIDPPDTGQVLPHKSKDLQQIFCGQAQGIAAQQMQRGISVDHQAQQPAFVLHFPKGDHLKLVPGEVAEGAAAVAAAVGQLQHGAVCLQRRAVNLLVGIQRLIDFFTGHDLAPFPFAPFYHSTPAFTSRGAVGVYTSSFRFRARSLFSPMEKVLKYVCSMGIHSSKNRL